MAKSNSSSQQSETGQDYFPGPASDESMQPSFITPPPTRRHARMRLEIALILLAILITLGGFIGQRLMSQAAPLPQTANTTQAGPFVQLPLNDSQINSLRHLTAHMQYKQLASLYTARMTIDEELGQLIMVEYADTSYSADLDTMIHKLHAGGVIMYEFQMLTAAQTSHDIAQMQKRADFPLFISTDEEGGPYVHRLLNIYPPRMSATDIFNTGDVNVATREGHHTAHDLLSLGINEDLAPDVDVQLVPGYDLVTRTFGNSPDSVIKYAGAYMKAMQSDGVTACIKHFPGLGDAVIDAHAGLPVINRTRDQIYSVELAPFKYFIQTPDQLERPGMIMPTDVLMPAIDPIYPAELSHTFMTDILRNQFGYDGVALTDALYMKGVEINGRQISMAQAGVMALQAGDDMLLGPTGTAQMLDMIQALKAAYMNGSLSKSRIDEAVTRILALKMEKHLMPAIPPQG
ncbi:MAG TPA: glycoside hydrolase family 3 N-terminal domain-containing protein [Ktedonobacteraceae bacterium]|nr:glycoside hydrolase family 3 N-terminal domain-containing protein [Ktedonobacteraceae bacterium]